MVYYDTWNHKYLSDDDAYDLAFDRYTEDVMIGSIDEDMSAGTYTVEDLIYWVSGATHDVGTNNYQEVIRAMRLGRVEDELNNLEEDFEFVGI